MLLYPHCGLCLMSNSIASIILEGNLTVLYRLTMHNASSRLCNHCMRAQNKTYEDKIWRVNFLDSDSNSDLKVTLREY